MEFYIYISDKPDESLPVGIESMGNFWPEDGFTVLCNMINAKHPLLEKAILITDQGNKISIDKFLTRLKKLQIKKH